MGSFAWSDVELFLEVKNAGSLLKAADRIGTTQPTLGRRIDHLEKRLGCKVFERSRAGVTLTTFGESLIPLAETMARSASQISKIANSQSDKVEGTVGISAPDGLAAYWIVPKIVTLQKQYPKLRLTLDSGLWPSKNGQFSSDMSIDYRDPDDQRMLRVPLCWLHYSMFASQDLLKRFDVVDSVAQAIAMPFVKHVSHDTQLSQWDDKALAASELMDGEFFHKL